MPVLVAAVIIALAGILSFGAAGKRLRPRRSRAWFRLFDRAAPRAAPAKDAPDEKPPA